MASNIKGDIRTLEGAFVNLLALSSLKKEDINLSLAKTVLEKHVGKTQMNQINKIAWETKTGVSALFRK